MVDAARSYAGTPEASRHGLDAGADPPSEQQLAIRVGLYSGPVFASVISRKMPHVALIGNTTNVASRMESTCDPNCVHMGPTTAQLIKEAQGQGRCRDLLVEPRGTINIKGKGPMETYWLRPAHRMSAASGLQATTAWLTAVIPRRGVQHRRGAQGASVDNGRPGPLKQARHVLPAPARQLPGSVALCASQDMSGPLVTISEEGIAQLASQAEAQKEVGVTNSRDEQDSRDLTAAFASCSKDTVH
mmetsp:Transcript_6348/g.15758  ORF Transcript_6348/g.15758 Transcript_6348/m.15758 type:complete len:245 (-) Transcript_6348:529-1263(-)